VSPLVTLERSIPALKGRNTYLKNAVVQGRRAALRYALAHGFHISAPLALVAAGLGNLAHQRAPDANYFASALSKSPLTSNPPHGISVALQRLTDISAGVSKMQSAQQQEADEAAMGRQGADFRSLLQAIHSSSISNLSLVHPRGKVLFAEGEPARGVFILRTGRAASSISSSEGRVVILRIAQTGDVLGLNSVLRNAPYNTTVKTVEPCRTEFIPRKELVELMERSQPTAQAIAQLLSRDVAELTDRVRSLLLSQTANAKLAKLLLEWSEHEPQITKSFTHEEIAHMICSSRETVTRLLATLNRGRVISVRSDSILISDRAALQKIAVG
jgi:CRP/FNR family transcriptional regulator